VTEQVFDPVRSSRGCDGVPEAMQVLNTEFILVTMRIQTNSKRDTAQAILRRSSVGGDSGYRGEDSVGEWLLLSRFLHR
jgi:hypothetical protein